MSSAATSTPPTPPPYSIAPRQPGQWMDPKTGFPTREFYRFILNLFQSAGSGQANTNLAALMAEVQNLIDGEAALEASFKILDDYVMTMRTVDLSPIENALQEIVAYVMTVRGLNSTVSQLQGKVSQLEAFVLTKR